MRDPVPRHRADHRRVIELVRKLRRVHADHHEPVAETVLEVTQFLDDAETVDATERPEIEDHHTSAQLAQGERNVRVDPSAGAPEFGCAHAPGRRRHDANIISRAAWESQLATAVWSQDGAQRPLDMIAEGCWCTDRTTCRGAVGVTF